MCFHFLSIAMSTESLAWISVQEKQDDLSGLLWHGVRDLEWALLNVFEELRLACVEVRRNSDEHLVDQDAKEVPINAASMSRSPQHLWCEIGYRAAER